MNRPALSFTAFLMGLAMSSRPVWGDSVPVDMVTGSVWRIPGSFVGAPHTDVTGAALEGGFSAEAIHFFGAGDQISDVYLRQLLPHGIALASATFPGLAEPMRNCSTMSGGGVGSTCYSTVVEVDGDGTFHGGTKYSLTPAGALLKIAGSWAIESAGATWTPGADVTGPFTIYYADTYSDAIRTPESVEIKVLDGGATVVLLGSALVLIQGLRRTLRA